MSDFNSGEPFQSKADPKLISIVSYLTIVGWIVAMILNNPKSELASFHIRQSLGILMLGTLARFVHFVPFGGDLAATVGGVLTLVLWIIGFLAALQGEQKIVPVLGEAFQDWFKAL
jgi:uncharacterized membrane protein